MNSTNIKVATVSPKNIYIGAPSLNAKYMAKLVNSLEEDTGLVVFPELSLTGATCGDLFKEQTLIDSAQIALTDFMHLTKNSKKIICIGMPFVYKNKLYNCAVFVQGFKVLAVIPKTSLTIEDKKYFTAFDGNRMADTILVGNTKYYFGNKVLLVDSSKVKNQIMISCDIGIDLFSPITPNTIHSINGANVNINISAMKKTLNSENKILDLTKNHSSRCKNTHIYCSASCDESTADIVMSNQHIISENGKILLDDSKNEVSYSIINPNRNRYIKNTLDDFDYIVNYISDKDNYRIMDVEIQNTKNEKIVSLTPFTSITEKNISEIIDIQTKGLGTRLKKIRCEKVVIGVSGGSDSTLALLVAVETFKRNNYDLKNIIGITMPCFGTSQRTKNNSIELMKRLGITVRTIDISEAVKVHLENINHPLDLYDISYENAQARERTQVLMDIANYENALVVGTGDLSELALGWCTYNGDHISNYSVNASIPKTLIKKVISVYKDDYTNDDVKEILNDILDTPVSPELLPPNKDGTISQITENSIGSYLVHDFVLYYMMKYKLKPSEIFELYVNSHLGQLSKEEKVAILKNMEIFYKRFFTQQFKRNCLPDGPSIGSINFSPRGYWNMPSDASYEEWIKDLGKWKN